MEFRGFMTEFIRSELEDAVGTENVSSTKGEKLAYGTDYFWVSRMVIDKGGMPALPDLIVRPASAEEVSKVLKIANYYKIPVQTWGGGSGTQGGALPMAGGILLDVKRITRFGTPVFVPLWKTAELSTTTTVSVSSLAAS